MIDFTFLEENKRSLREKYLTARPFPHLILDDFCDPSKAERMWELIPELENKSRDYMFANNKFEKANYKELGDLFNEYYEDIRSERFNKFLSYISNEEVFVDPKNHGGGLHQGKKNSFLNMHLDFNYHPINKDWYRTMNLLYYMNKGWQKNYGGELKVENLLTGEKNEIEVPFNRLLIQQCGPHTLHGYEMTSFPEGNYRTSIATYAYTVHHRKLEKPRTTDWFPDEDSSVFKKTAAKYYNTAVQIKNKFFGIGTAQNN